MLRQIEAIEIGDRFRRSLGDLDGLVDSIERVGLLQPLVITPENRLIAGQRRLEAVKRLGWDSVPVVIADGLDDALRFLQAERDENTEREPFTPSEAVALRRVLEPLEQAAAKERQAATQGNRQTGVEKFSAPEKGRALDKIADAAGVSRTTLEKATDVVEAAEAEPERYGPLVEEMDRTRKVNGAHQVMEAAIRETVPGVLEALDAGDVALAKKLVKPIKKRTRRPAADPAPLTDLQKTQGIRLAVEALANPPLTAAEFKSLALPYTVQFVRELIPAARLLLDEIEVEP